MATTIYVSFVDSSETTVNGVFSGPGNSVEVWPHQGALPSNDPRYSAYYDALGQAAEMSGLVAPGD